MNRRRSYLTTIAFFSVSMLAAACSGGSETVTITVGVGDAFRLADATIKTASDETAEPAVADLHAAFEIVKQTTSLPQQWQLLDVSSVLLEVQLLVPIATPTTTTTKATNTTSGLKPAPKTEASTTLVATTAPKQSVVVAACIRNGPDGWVAKPKGCTSKPAVAPETPATVTDSIAPPTDLAPATAHPAHWSYSGDSGPDHWAELDPAFSVCASGAAQTPINIKDPTPAALDDPVFAYASGPVTVSNTGQTVQITARAGNFLTVGGVSYALKQASFHAPSEHTIGGVHVPVEVQFEHKAENGALAIVAVMIVKGVDDNAAWGSYVQTLTAKEGADVPAEFNWAEMLPSGKASLRYQGSLTTPPCTEGVTWVVLNEPVTVSADQIHAFENAYSGNNRPLQGLDGRVVNIDSTRG